MDYVWQTPANDSVSGGHQNVEYVWQTPEIGSVSWTPKCGVCLADTRNWQCVWGTPECGLCLGLLTVSVWGTPAVDIFLRSTQVYYFQLTDVRRTPFSDKNRGEPNLSKITTNFVVGAQV